MNRIERSNIPAIILSAAFLSACGGSSSQSTNANNAPAADPAPTNATATNQAIAVVVPVFDPAICPAGGVDVAVGVDSNGDGVLNGDEVDTSQVYCDDPLDPATAIAVVSEIAPGSACAAGGVRVDSGVDENQDGALGADEITDTQTLCNEIVADDPVPQNLVAHLEELPGGNCEFGGTRIDAGLDSNGNGVLDADEITATDFICTAAPEAFSGLVYIADALIDEVDAVFRTDPSTGDDSPLALPRLNPGGAMTLRLSPDKSKVAILGNLERAGSNELYIADTLSGQLSIKASGSPPNGGDVRGDYAWSPDGSLLAYRADQDRRGVIELFIVNADGTNNRKLSAELPVGADVDSFAWSPDGSRIAFVADQTTRNVLELFTVRPDGSELTQVSGLLVTGGDVHADFRWSPNADRLLYRADAITNNVFELFAVDGDGSNLAKLSPTPVRNGDVLVSAYAWSPNGSTIAYRADLEQNALNELFAVNPDGSNHRQISGAMVGGGDALGLFAWSPDSSSIAYLADQNVNNVNGLYTVALDGSGNTRVSNVLALGGDVEAFAWSPLGDRLAYRANQDSLDTTDLYVVTPDGLANTRVSDIAAGTGNTADIQWAPDGSVLAYRVVNAGETITELFTAASDGTANTLITTGFVDGQSVVDFAWSPDSTRIAYSSNQDDIIAIELYTSDPSGSDTAKVSREMNLGGNVGAFSW
ncbi:MAG: hypothetical protein AAF434_08015 [Pseudomonadota bacterium]